MLLTLTWISHCEKVLSSGEVSVSKTETSGMSTTIVLSARSLGWLWVLEYLTVLITYTQSHDSHMIQPWQESTLTLWYVE